MKPVRRTVHKNGPATLYAPVGDGLLQLTVPGEIAGPGCPTSGGRENVPAAHDARPRVPEPLAGTAFTSVAPAAIY